MTGTQTNNSVLFNTSPSEHVTEEHFQLIKEHVYDGTAYTVDEASATADRFAKIVFYICGEASEDFLIAPKFSLEVQVEKGQENLPAALLGWNSYIKTIRNENTPHVLPELVTKTVRTYIKNNPDSTLTNEECRNLILFYYGAGDYLLKERLSLNDNKPLSSLDDLERFFDLVSEQAMKGTYTQNDIILRLAFLNANDDDHTRWGKTLPKFFGAEYLRNVILHGFKSKEDVDGLSEWPEEWITAMVEGE